MGTVLKLDSMTTAQKLQAMEELWDDLSRSEEGVESPDWHRVILEERESQLGQGEDHFVSWEAAKEELSKRKR